MEFMCVPTTRFMMIYGVFTSEGFLRKIGICHLQFVYVFSYRGESMWFSRQLHLQLLNPPTLREQRRGTHYGPTLLVMDGRNTQGPKPTKLGNLMLLLSLSLSLSLSLLLSLSLSLSLSLLLLLFAKQMLGKETLRQKWRGEVWGDVSAMFLAQLFKQLLLPSTTTWVSFIWFTETLRP